MTDTKGKPVIAAIEELTLCKREKQNLSEKKNTGKCPGGNINALYK